MTTGEFQTTIDEQVEGLRWIWRRRGGRRAIALVVPGPLMVCVGIAMMIPETLFSLLWGALVSMGTVSLILLVGLVGLILSQRASRNSVTKERAKRPGFYGRPVSAVIDSEGFHYRTVYYTVHIGPRGLSEVVQTRNLLVVVEQRTAVSNAYFLPRRVLEASGGTEAWERALKSLVPTQPESANSAPQYPADTSASSYKASSG